MTKTALFYVGAAIAEIAGCFGFWLELALTAHVAASVDWLGAVGVFLAFAVAALGT